MTKIVVLSKRRAQRPKGPRPGWKLIGWYKKHGPFKLYPLEIGVIEGFRIIEEPLSNG